MKNVRFIGAVGIGAAIIAWGCSTSGAGMGPVSASRITAADSQINQDVAAITAPEIATAAYGLLGVEPMGLGVGLMGGPWHGGGMPWSGGGSGARQSVRAASSNCKVDSLGGGFGFGHESIPDTVSFVRTVEFFANSTCENAFDSTATDSIAFTAAFYESDTDSSFTSRRYGNWAYDVAGQPTLDSAPSHIWNGVGASADTSMRIRHNHKRTYQGVAFDTATNVTYPNPRHGWRPDTGTISRWLSATVTDSSDSGVTTKNISRHFTVTFSSSDSVPMKEHDGDRGTMLLGCNLDMGRRRLVPGSCR